MPLGKAWGDFINVENRRPRRFSGSGDDDLTARPAGFKVSLLVVLTTALFLWLLANLIKIQIFAGDYYRQLAEGNRIAEIVIHAPRGIIYDRNDVPLVINLPAYRLKQCNSLGENCSSTAISKDQAITLEANGLGANQQLEVDSVRSYPMGPAFAHVLGYVSAVTKGEMKSDQSYSMGDVTGRGGVEEEYQSLLRGKDGKQLVQIDALGKPGKVLAEVPPVPGIDLHLTIDANMQKAAYDQIRSSKGAVVVTDPNNGEILALASGPSFDPNSFTDLNLSPADRLKEVGAIINDNSQPLFDRGISGTYPAGSTFKIVTATAGLESGKIDANFQIEDPGVLVIGPYKFPNWKFLQDGGTQGTLNVVSAIQKSNDIFFYEVGGMVGVDDLGVWAKKMGVDRKLGVDLPGEEAGIFPTASWRAANVRSWYLGDTYHLAIGQGDLLVTPLQDNAWTSVIANGGKLCRPHILQPSAVSGQKLTDCQNIGISPKTLNLVKEGLIEACSPGGTAWPLFNFTVGNGKDPTSGQKRQIQIACKTGTAEYGDPQNRTHAWLTSFAPAEKPEIAVTVIIEGGGEGDTVAAPAVKKILEEWFTR